MNTILARWPFGVVFCVLLTGIGLALWGTPTQASPSFPYRTMQFEAISSEQGISGNSVYSIVQDSRGFLWFGTDDGVNRYDGYEFKVFRHDPDDPHSVSYNKITCMYEDQSDQLWIGTQGGGVNRFDFDTEHFIRFMHDPADPFSLSSNMVTTLYEDQAQRLWVGTDRGLHQFDPKTGQFIRYQHDRNDPHTLNHDHIQALYADPSGRLWVTTPQGLNWLDPESGEALRCEDDPEFPRDLCNACVHALVEDTSGRLWFSVYNGLYSYHLKSGEYHYYAKDPQHSQGLRRHSVTTLYQEHSGLFWIGAEGGGLGLFDPETQQFFYYTVDPTNHNGLRSNFIASIYEDHAGIVWIGTYGSGLAKYSRRQQQFRQYFHNGSSLEQIRHHPVSTLYEDRDGVLWIGANGNGVYAFDQARGKLTHYLADPDQSDRLSHNTIWTILEDHEGLLWFGTEGGGVSRLNRKNGKFTTYRHEPGNPHSVSGNIVSTLLEDSHDVLWVGTLGAGLNTFDRKTERFASFPCGTGEANTLSSCSITSLFEDSSGILWIGTFGGGLNRLDPRTNRIISYKNAPNAPDSLSNNVVWSMYEDQAGRFWVATAGGLNKLDRETERFRHYRQQDGLPSDVIYGMLEDADGYLWMSTGNGLTKFDPDLETFNNYDQHDGLQDNTFHPKAFFKNDNGMMFFGGLRGFNSFFPERITTNFYIPPVALTDFQLFNQSVGPGDEYLLPSRESHPRPDKDTSLQPHPSPLTRSITETEEITLSYKESVFAFEFAALDYSIPEKNQYAYMMEGFDEDWIHCGTRRYVQYTNLPPGQYTFRVKAANNDGIWNESGRAVNVTIVPAFWQTFWFRMLLRAGIAGLLIVGYLKRTHYIRSQKRTLEIQVQERTKALQDNMRRLEDEIIERRYAEEALKKSEEYNRSIIETMNEGLAALDQDNRVIYANSKLLEMFGYTRDEILHRPVSDFLTPENAQKLREHVRCSTSTKTNRTQSYELQWLRKDGSIFPAIVSPQPFYDQDGKWAGGVAVLTDITELKRVEAELREAKAFAISIINNVPEVIYSTDDNMNLTYISPKCEQLYGYTKDEFFHTPDLFTRLIHPDDLVRVIGELKTLFSGNVVTAEYRILRKDGQSLWVRELATPSLDERGKLQRIDASVYDITELKQAEEALRKSDEQHRLLIQTMNEGLVMLNADDMISYANERLCEILGYTFDELAQHPVSEFLDDTNRAIVQRQLEQRRQGSAERYEVTWLRKDGASIPTIISPKPLFDDNQQFAGSFAVVTDISQIKHAERETMYLAAIIEGTEDMAIIKDLDLRAIAVNQAYARAVTKPMTDIIGKTEAEIWTGEADEEEIQQWIEDDLKVQELQPGEQIVKEQSFCLQGRCYTVLTKNFPIFDKHGKLIATADISTDITDRKKFEEALRESEEKYRVLFENLQNVFYRADNQGNVMLVSPSCERVFGYTPDEAVHLNLVRDIYAYPQQRKEFMEKLQQQGYIHDFEIQLRRKDGTIIWGSVTSHFYRDKTGKTLGVEGTVMDITGRKQTEERLIEANIELTATLEDLKRTQSQLIQSEKMAALGVLIAGIAHEINTPLGAIQSSIVNISRTLEHTLKQLPEFFQQLPKDCWHEFFAVLDRALKKDHHTEAREERAFRRAIRKELKQQQIDHVHKVADLLVDMGIYEGIQPYLPLLRHPEHLKMLKMAYQLSGLQESSQTISTATEQASKVVKALKSYSHPKRSKEKIEVHLTEGIDTVLTLYHNKLKHGVEVRRHYDPLPAILCYPDELNQVWTNLFHNAVQAMKGKGVLEIGVTQRDSQAVVQITDSGCGIPPEIQARIFEPFFTTKPAGQGTGLGLDIVQKIIQKHEGHIEVTSEPGRTTFTITLPILTTT